MVGFLFFCRVYGLKQGRVASARLLLLLLINNLAKLMQSKERAKQEVYLASATLFLCVSRLGPAVRR